MKKAFLLFVFAFAFVVAFSSTSNAQVTDTAKKVGKITKNTTVTGVRKTNRGLHKGWYISKRTGRKVWIKSKGITNKSYKVTKKAVKKIT